MEDVFPDVASGEIQAFSQGVRQIIALAVTLGIALVGGLIVGRCLVNVCTLEHIECLIHCCHHEYILMSYSFFIFAFLTQTEMTNGFILNYTFVFTLKL